MCVNNKLNKMAGLNAPANLALKRVCAFAAIVFIGISGASLATTAQAAVVFKPLVREGQERPDKADPNSADFFSGVACGVVEGNDVVFRSMHDGFRTGFDSIWTIKANATGLRKIVGKNRLAPGGFGKFMDFGSNNGGDYTTSPLLHNGLIAFLGHDSNPNTDLRGAGGLYSVRLSNAVIKRVANYNTPNPSLGGFLFGQFTGISQQGCHNAYAFNGKDVFFTAATLGNNDPSGVYQARYDGAGLKKVRDNNDPDTSFPFFQPRGFYAPTLGVNPVTGATFLGYAGYNVFGPQALYVGKQHSMLRSDNLPGDPSPATGGSSFDYFLFDRFTAVFYAEAGEDYYGIFSRRNNTGPIRKIVTNLDKLPGIDQCPINAIGNFIADAGRVFFYANTTNCDGLTANGRMGIFMAKDNKIERIIGIGDSLGDGSEAVEVQNELGPGSVYGKRLVFSVRTTKSNRTLYIATLP
ncbi:MAG: hypothetical protein PHR16_13865 [Methylovulum sp.]|nr:hypothetical protein [Methylovulum sp.]